MRVFEIMNAGVQNVPPTLAASEAWELMRRSAIHHLVVKQGPAILGVISDRDLGSRRGESVRAGRSVADLMSDGVVTIDANATVRQAANRMRGRSIGCMPVTRSGRLVGMVTVSDLLELLGRGIDRPALKIRPNLHFRVPHRRRAKSW